MSAVKVHLDTDIGGDPDDVCALAMLLGLHARGEVDLVGITTTADPDGRRAGWARHVVHLSGVGDDIPIAAGAAVSLTTGRTPGEVEEDARLWPAASTAVPRPSPPGAAIDLIDDAIGQGATLVAIGMFTNLATLENATPGRLAAASRVVVMGGWVAPPAPGLPQWGPDMDWNVQCDTIAAATVCEHAARTPAPNLAMATLSATLGAPLRADQLPAVESTGPVGRLVAEQSRRVWLGKRRDDVPADVVNYHYDPVAVALAVGWPHLATERRTLAPDSSAGALRFVDDPGGTPVDVLTSVDGDAFHDYWLGTLTRDR